MADILFIALAFYIVYKLVFDFVVPVYKTTTHVKQQFKNMQQQANASSKQQTQESKKEKANTAIGEYIDFEEVKKAER